MQHFTATLTSLHVFSNFAVGGGTAGCVVARRLAEASFYVLLLEAGGDPVPLESVPTLSMYQRFFPDINFLYESTPEKGAALRSGGVREFDSFLTFPTDYYHNSEQLALRFSRRPLERCSAVAPVTMT